MCGRFSISGDTFNQMVRDDIGCAFSAQASPDIRPSQQIATIIYQQGQLAQQEASWGIKPDWAKKQIINARAETVNEKKLFHHAMQNHRCLIPCSGWYEWHEEGGPRKQKYLFGHAENRPFYMAGIWFPGDTPELVTLTTSPDETCRPYHDRMPALIHPKDAWQWLEGNITSAMPLLTPDKSFPITVTAV
ncbi:SOS response-associated peptidase [Photobacterium sp. MCCC 1A19761]|uniref:SOS response-associated peptidase n=1 Tax=Photobacterium sp. MCCC 1A19761 TaxID=3115000 RepID=UPI00307E5020